MLEKVDISSPVLGGVSTSESALMASTDGITKFPNGTSTDLKVLEGRPELRRHSSATASLEDLSLGPAVVVPPQHMHKPSDAHETAAAMEMAKRRLEKVMSQEGGISTPTTPPVTTTTDRFAFAFDIDGVLIRGGKVIPQAIEAMKVLNGANGFGIKVYDEPSYASQHVP